VAGREMKLPRTPPYRDYIAWLREQDQNKAELFWRTALRGFTEPTRLPIDRHQPDLQAATHRHKHIVHKIGRQLSARLSDLSRTLQTTLNLVVAGAWALLLSRYSGERDVVMGISVSGRSGQVNGIETMIGLFFNTVPFPVRFRDADTVSVFLKNLTKS